MFWLGWFPTADRRHAPDLGLDENDDDGDEEAD